jgi:hypothetical protein
MSPAKQKKLFRAFAKQLASGKPPTDKQTEYLIYLFQGLGDGRDPSRILGLTYDNGMTREDDDVRSNLDLILHWIACATEEYTAQDGSIIKADYSMANAFEEGSRLAKKIFNSENPNSYSPEYIKKIWYQRKRKGKTSSVRLAGDQDSPYEY